MIIIAENFNSSIKKVETALRERDSTWLINQGRLIAESGAGYLDINAGIFMEDEAETLLYLYKTLQPVGVPFVIDSPDPDVIEYITSKMDDHNMLLNSITLEDNRFQKMSHLAEKTGAGLIALLMNKDSMPEGVNQRIEVAEELITRLRKQNISDNRIYLDPMIRPLATDDQAGVEALSVISKLRQKYPKIHIVVGLSNISFGLPARKYLNRAFLLQAMAMGLDSAICNPLDQELMALYHAAYSLSGQDEYCCEYLDNFRP